MLSKIASHKRTNIVWFHFYEVPWVVKSTETKSRMVMAGGSVEGESVFNGCRVSGWEDEEDAETDGGNGWTTVWMYLIPLNCMLRSDENGKFDAMHIFPQNGAPPHSPHPQQLTWTQESWPHAEMAPSAFTPHLLLAVSFVLSSLIPPDVCFLLHPWTRLTLDLPTLSLCPRPSQQLLLGLPSHQHCPLCLGATRSPEFLPKTHIWPYHSPPGKPSVSPHHPQD